jgi:CHAP domain
MSTLHLRQRLIDIASKEVGVTEVDSSNTGKRVVQYQQATDLGGTGWPWCAAFVCWCVREWLGDREVRDVLGIGVSDVEDWRPRTAAAYGFHNWARERGLLVMDDSIDNVLHTGDIVTYDFSHIGIVTGDSGNMIYTIEGNTDAGGSREGGGVWAKTRPRFLAKRFIRIML